MIKKILIADDEINIRNIMESFLIKEGYETECFQTGDELLQDFCDNGGDLIILDIMMPGKDGYEVCCEIRQISRVPIIMVSAKDQELDKIKGLNLGSDDYLTKPFSPLELVARVEALLRRANYDGKIMAPEPEIVILDLRLNEKRKSFTCHGMPLELTPTEYTLLSYLCKNVNRGIAREELLEQVWGFDSPIKTRATDDTLKRLRKKLADCQSKVRIQTIWGYGFMIDFQGEA